MKKKSVKRSEVVRALMKAREVVASSWCKGDYAVDADGVGCGPRAGCAERFCLAGALQRVTTPAVVKEAYAALQAVLPKKYRPSYEGSFFTEQPEAAVTEWNDGKHRRRKHVVRKLDRAVERLRAAKAT